MLSQIFKLPNTYSVYLHHGLLYYDSKQINDYYRLSKFNLTGCAMDE